MMENVSSTEAQRAVEYDSFHLFRSSRNNNNNSNNSTGSVSVENGSVSLCMSTGFDSTTYTHVRF